MKSTSLITCDYQGHAITLQQDGWFNATQAAAKYNKVPAEWLRLPSTVEYIAALKRHNPSLGKSHRSKAGPLATGGGTWLHPKLAVAFARWLDADFAVWCDAQIENLINSKRDWSYQRHMASASAKLMAESIKDTRTEHGKETCDHHYSNEHLLVNSLLTGERKPIDREQLCKWQLDFIARFDMRNSALILKEVEYQDRKAILQTEAKAWMAANQHRIGPANDAGKLAA